MNGECTSSNRRFLRIAAAKSLHRRHICLCTRFSYLGTRSETNGDAVGEFVVDRVTNFGFQAFGFQTVRDSENPKYYFTVPSWSYTRVRVS